ncbi:hypothetical protein [Streptacidiphilus carbonis]|uniref:hypothetical protein n=1 Tax=Streptacidiphilus carbonis TaxID=105422 RepID=UPI0005A6729E|nr:hypothetical protein [Streptacidiphilus carbonis]
MPEDLDTQLSTIAASAAAAARPHGPEAARRRGAQRTVHRRIAVSALSAAILAGGVGAALAWGQPGGDSDAVVPVVSPSVSASTGGPSPSAGPSRSPSSPPAPTSSGTGNAPPALSLQLPTALAKGTANLVGFTATNSGAARTETVTVNLGTPTGGAPMSTTPSERGIVQRQDGPGGAWVAVPVSYTAAASGMGADTATYRLSLPAGTSVQEHLRVTPVGVESVSFRVSLVDGATAPVSQARTLPLAAPTITATGPSSVKHGTTSAESDFTLTNGTTADYSAVGLYFDAYGSTAYCSYTPFTTAQWWNGASWQNISLAQQWPRFDTVPLAAGQSVTLRFRLIVPPTHDACLTAPRGQLSITATNGTDGPGGGSTTVSTVPSFSVRGDTPFFSIS